ncbi:four-carbon acid sugar kinase family protein [Kocuria sp. M1N1S27]|uniref:four-carbon acid sugar kinase family protein n=1 Tax=Kocuria kalidii TaxID=3376283 RepID=UPI0037926BE0
MATPRTLLVLDDDPTGSQCVHDVDVVLEIDPGTVLDVVRHPGRTCFVLTNSRARPEEEAVAINTELVSAVLESLAAEHLPLPHLVSRSDSTLRGHVVAEPTALADALEQRGVAVDGFLFAPAMIEAGRYTEGDVHYAVLQGRPMPVGETDFAADATFGYSSSDLRDFLVERSGGTLQRDSILSIGLDDIRSGGVPAVADILRRARDRTWVVVNATDYADLDTVAEALAVLEAEGRTFVTRCGPSFVRPLAGLSDSRRLGPEDISVGPGRLPHGLVAVGSHVGLTNRQLAELRARRELFEVELDVPTLLDDDARPGYVADAAERIIDALASSDAVVWTSRELVRTDDPGESLAIARSVSDALVEVVHEVAQARPAWVVAKGGITSHEVAHRGLGIRRATVAGQFFPGQISMFQPTDAPDTTRGGPYVVFPGNVGGESALADVVGVLDRAAELARSLDPRRGHGAGRESDPNDPGQHHPDQHHPGQNDSEENPS